MHEDYNDSYDEEGDDQYDYDHPSLNPYKWFFKFDVGSDTPLSKWMSDIVNNFLGSSENYTMPNIHGFPSQMFPVNSWNPNTAGNAPQYLGSNYQGSPIWKPQYFIKDELNSTYKNHLLSHAKHFVQQPHYYKGMFDILN